MDRESAFEILAQRVNATQASSKPNAAKKPSSRQSDNAAEAFFKSLVRAVGSKLGQSLVRGILGSLKR